MSANLTVDQLLRLNGFTSDEEEAFKAGFDAGLHGSSMANTHFRFFRKKLCTTAWEKGRDAGNEERKRRTSHGKDTFR